jgi:hypothetical protein
LIDQIGGNYYPILLFLVYSTNYKVKKKIEKKRNTLNEVVYNKLIKECARRMVTPYWKWIYL